ncbi:uncharacterized protein LOC133459246 [Cololabis saira]|uniref:uncharacterized protein LOC133459246 n=1 Tax=Cololabis saira TaxID=129043 RepID=UPI002AD26158|nr:uncharacterized protein LOC133459246 [Cololabis saira]
MQGGLKLRRLLQGLFLVLLAPAYEASSLGLTVHVVPLDSDGGNMVRAHFSAIAPSPCPDFSSVCGAGEDCVAHTTSLPFTGTKPSPGWCVRQWQKTVPSNYTDVLTLGSTTQFYVSINASPKIRANSGKINNPAYVALPPPLRARVNCPHRFQLSVKDLDGDRVQCRFAQADKGECLNCTRHSFIELDEEKCTVAFTGDASPGQYFIYLMAEDVIPAPKANEDLENEDLEKPLSSVPVHLSLSVEGSATRCSEETMAIKQAPKQNSVLFVLPFEEVKFSISYNSVLESISEIAVVGPPELYRTDLTSGTGLNVAWIRSENTLTRILPICFVANTNSLQSELQCVWLYQREMRTLPAGTELRCDNTEMTLVLPVGSLININLDELQLNSPTCPVTYNSTHLTARISLDGCGTKTVHAGTELVYTNTLQSVRPYTMVSRKPSLVLPLACRFQKAQVKGPQYKIGVPSPEETFGTISVWMEIHLPGEGPLAKFTSNAKLRSNYLQPGRVRREVEEGKSSHDTSTGSTDNESAIGSRIQQLDLHLMSNCSVDRAEMVVSDCIESETEDFAESHPIMNDGCMAANNTFEVVTTKSNSKVYRLNLDSMITSGSMMYIQCSVKLCIATMPSEKCPDLCTESREKRMLIGSVFTRTYTLRSGPVSLVVTTPAPKIPTTTTPTTTTTLAATQSTSTSHAPEVATTSMAVGVILTTIRILLQNFIFN